MGVPGRRFDLARRGACQVIELSDRFMLEYRIRHELIWAGASGTTTALDGVIEPLRPGLGAGLGDEPSLSERPPREPDHEGASDPHRDVDDDLLARRGRIERHGLHVSSRDMPGLECHDVRRDDRSVSGGRLPKDDVVAVPHCVAIIDEEFDCLGG